MKANILEIYKKVPFRTFANSFRKNIDPSFKAINKELKSGRTFKDVGSYVIGDGGYYIDEDKYKGFAKDFGIEIPEKNTFEKGGLIAPNGNKSNLTPEQYKLVRTPQFKAWFGDWENDPQNSSKVVDENGEPLVVYHGTTSDFNIFTKNNIGKNDYGFFGEGFYFGNISIAKTYSQTSDWDEMNNTLNPNGRVLSCFLNVRNPLIDSSKNIIQSKDTIKEFTKNTIKNFDGVIAIPYQRFSPNTEYVVFEPNQIKLADGTNTTFDSNSDDIRYEKGGQINPDNKQIKDMITHKSGNAGGLLVGNRHSEGGIKAINQSTDTPIEMEGGEVVITRNAVSDDTKREFEGEMLTNREILSRINVSGGGVSFANGGDVPTHIMVSGKTYKYGGKTMKDSDIVSSCGCQHKMKDGGVVDLQNMLVNELNTPKMEEKQSIQEVVVETPIVEEHMPEIVNNFQIGTIIYAVSSNGSVDDWTITQFDKDGLHLKHTPKSPLSTSMDDRYVSYSELLDLYKNNLISIKGYKTFDELDLTIFLLKHRVGRYQTYYEEGGVLVDLGKNDDQEEMLLMQKQFGENKKFD